MEIELYDRTWEQNEDLGLNDMKVEGYEQGEEAES
jgi:zinc finger protein